MESLLNLILSVLGSEDVRGSNWVVMLMPFARALGGKRVRKSRATFARDEKGLNRVVTSEMNRVNMFVVGVEKESGDGFLLLVMLMKKIGCTREVPMIDGPWAGGGLQAGAELYGKWPVGDDVEASFFF